MTDQTALATDTPDRADLPASIGLVFHTIATAPLRSRALRVAQYSLGCYLRHGARTSGEKLPGDLDLLRQLHGHLLAELAAGANAEVIAPILAFVSEEVRAIEQHRQHMQQVNRSLVEALGADAPQLV